jgi:hypothetical protein
MRCCIAPQGLFSGARVLLALSSMLYIHLGDALTIIFTELVWCGACSAVMMVMVMMQVSLVARAVMVNHHW